MGGSGFSSASVNREFGGNSGPDLGETYVVALWEVSYIVSKRFDLDTLRMPNRSPTPISKSNDFLAQSSDVWGGGQGPHFRPIWVVPGVWAGFENSKLLAF